MAASRERGRLPPQPGDAAAGLRGASDWASDARAAERASDAVGKERGRRKRKTYEGLAQNAAAASASSDVQAGLIAYHADELWGPGGP